MDGHLVENFEAAFQNCFAAVTSHNHYNVGDIEEVKSSVEQNIQKYLDVARQLECFFLQKRQLLCLHKPEQVLKEEIVDMKQELARKEILIQRHHEKLQHWQTMLSRAHSGQQQQQQQAGTAGSTQGQTSTSLAQQTVNQPGIQSQSSASVTIPQTVTAVNISQAVSAQQNQVAAAAAAANTMLPQGPLAYLEQTTSSIGLPERR